MNFGLRISDCEFEKPISRGNADYTDLQRLSSNDLLACVLAPPYSVYQRYFSFFFTCAFIRVNPRLILVHFPPARAKAREFNSNAAISAPSYVIPLSLICFCASSTRL